MHENRTTCTIVHVSGDFCFEILDTKHSPPTTNKSTYRNCFSIRFTWSGKHICVNLPCLISMNVETQTRLIFFPRFWHSLHELLHQVIKRTKGKNILISLINGNIFHFVKILRESTPSTKKDLHFQNAVWNYMMFQFSPAIRREHVIWTVCIFHW